jgi:histidinol dehydrogenase
MGALAVRRLRDLDPAERERILARSTAAIFDPELVAGVRAIIEDVRARGDAAVCDALERFDGVECTPAQLRVAEAELATACDRVADDVIAAVRRGIANIRAFNERVLEGASWRAEIAPGLLVGEETGPIASAGLFVPSGKGSFPSVLMHIGTPAVVAGVEDIIVLVPPSAGHGRDVDAAVLAVAGELGLTEVFRTNGPAGIAAAAFGTETIPRVVKIVGPGSPAVTSAQVQMQAYGCATAMLFGASESLVIADETADPAIVAADLLNEAEHGDDSVALLVTPSETLVATVAGEIDRQLETLPQPRRNYASVALSRTGGALLVRDLAEACEFANEFAPEHLLLSVREPEALLPKLDHAGEILLGDTPFAAANYLIGVPNTLPTGRYARLASGVNARTFVKTTSIARTSPAALGELSAGIIALARHEGFPAHAAAILARGLMPGPSP